MRVCVEGNIGSGKSTVLAEIATAFPAISVRQEPIKQWGNLLELYYADPATWSLAFNLKVLHSFHSVSSHVIERSPGACRHVFGQLAYNDNHLSPAAWDVFKEYHDLLGWEPDAYVYIDTPSDVCLSRLLQRGRECEAGVTEEYLKRIEFQYQNFLKFAKVPVVRLDGTQDPATLAKDVVALFSQS
jgi:deoxyadenosine/deoxycytidine kinase